jgi:hypothetical protein
MDAGASVLNAYAQSIAASPLEEEYDRRFTPSVIRFERISAHMKLTSRVTSFESWNRLRRLVGSAVGMLLVIATTQAARADIIPYATPGLYNPITYSFTAASTGHVTAYFVSGGGASYSNDMGLLRNGVLTPAGFGLNNHTSSVGQSFDLGLVNAGDSLVFVMRNNTLGAFAYSDPSLNVGYDNSGVTGHNHIYSTAYTQSPPIDSIPSGTYVAFEDLRFPFSDFNYNDESFIFTNTTIHSSATPEPSTLVIVGGVGLIGIAVRRLRRKNSA